MGVTCTERAESRIILDTYLEEGLTSTDAGYRKCEMC